MIDNKSIVLEISNSKLSDVFSIRFQYSAASRHFGDGEGFSENLIEENQGNGKYLIEQTPGVETASDIVFIRSPQLKDVEHLCHRAPYNLRWQCTSIYIINSILTLCK